ncbi:MAG: hypothetical protein ACRELG_00980 [Gemmataceae bacterium]
MPAVAAWHALTGDLREWRGGVAVWRHKLTRDGTTPAGAGGLAQSNGLPGP